MADHLSQDVFPELRVALLHGRLKQDAKDRVMGAFVRGEFDILVSTTVVEVGVDVPNATVMVDRARRALRPVAAASAARPRRPRRAQVVLRAAVPVSRSPSRARERLKALTDTTDGFEIAERDLQLRGPGDFFGTRQSGMPTLRVGDLLRDHALMERRAAKPWPRSTIPSQAAALTALVNTGWEQRFGLVGSDEEIEREFRTSGGTCPIP